MATLTEHEREIYELAKKSLSEHTYKNQRTKTAYRMIKEFGDGIKMGDRFYRASDGAELDNLTQILKALRTDDLIVESVRLLYGIGG